MENWLIYIPIGAILIGLFAVMCRVLTDGRRDDEIEDELETDIRTADELAVTAREQSARIEKDKELSEKIRECDSGITDCIREAERIITEARKRSRTTESLVTECEEILSKAKKI